MSENWYGYGRGVDDYQSEEITDRPRFESFCQAHWYYTHRHAQYVVATSRNNDIMVVLLDRTDAAGEDIARRLDFADHQEAGFITEGSMRGVLNRRRVVEALSPHIPFGFHLGHKILDYKGLDPLVLVVYDGSIQVFTVPCEG